MSECRGLSLAFRETFKDGGLLAPVLRRVKQDHTLDFQIRCEEVHIYYRGGKILGLRPSASCSVFHCSFDSNYFISGMVPEIVEALPGVATAPNEIQAWLAAFPELKQGMDFYLSGKVQKNEREFQQTVIRENNYANIANDTDYFIVDTEYVHPSFSAGRVDLVAFKWKSEGPARKKGKVGLSLIEAKYGDGALKNSSGVFEHVQRMCALARDDQALQVMKNEMLTVFAQKRDLDLIRFGSSGNPNPVDTYLDDPPEVTLLIINHDPAKSRLLTELESLDPEDAKLVKVGTSNFLGYGLYEEAIFSLEEFLARYERQVHSKTRQSKETPLTEGTA